MISMALSVLTGVAIALFCLALGYKAGFKEGAEHGKFLLKCGLLMGDTLDITGSKFHLEPGPAPSLLLPGDTLDDGHNYGAEPEGCNGCKCGDLLMESDDSSPCRRRRDRKH